MQSLGPGEVADIAAHLWPLGKGMTWGYIYGQTVKKVINYDRCVLMLGCSIFCVFYWVLLYSSFSQLLYVQS